MRLAICSDLHLEFGPLELTNDENADVLILSGDIMLSEPLHNFPADYDNTTIVSKYQMQAIRFRQFLRDCSERFSNVIYVAGNHEFYHGKFNAGLDYLKEECSNYANVHFLEASSVKIKDVLFVGATLWTDCNKGDPLTLYQLQYSMSDFKIITYDKDIYRKLNPTDTVRRHHKTLDYFEAVVENTAKDSKIVVCTHHSPSELSIHPIYQNQFEMNGAYHSDLSKFVIDNPQIKVWVHGHTHHNFDYMLGESRVICNPRGYIGYEESANNFKLKYIEVQ
jgi:predicted phosphodiesterase